MTELEIECAPDGPYLVKNLDRLRNSRGDRLPTKPITALCRCGRSSSKPFCDGTHKQTGFSDKRLTDGQNARRMSYAGERVTIHDNRELCAHAGYCTDGLRQVFDSERSPWIDPHGASVEKITAIVQQCPSGALSYSLDGVEQRNRTSEPSITVTENGPYAVVGGPRLIGSGARDGTPMDRITLCRCGASRNKPFCDGSHWNVEFKDEKN